MSLTTFLENPEVKQKLKEEFIKPIMVGNVDLLAPPVNQNGALIGTAFDYLLRFYIRQNNHLAEDSQWVAENSLIIMGDPSSDKKPYQTAKKIIELAKLRLKYYLEDGVITDDLIRSTLQLAQLDMVYRGGKIPDYLGITDEDDVKDLRNLINIVDPDIFKAKELCLLNPSFGDGSVLVGGADADLIIDNTLIDIKTTKHFKFNRIFFNQLVGYAILQQIGLTFYEGSEDDLENYDLRFVKCNIEKIGIYYARFGYLHTINLKDITEDGAFNPDLLEWFVGKAVEMFSGC